MWLKYDSAPILIGEQWSRNQPARLSEHQKPSGFWITDDSEDCWRSWCVGEQWGLDGLTHKHEIVLDETNILILRNQLDVECFAEKYRVIKRWGKNNEWADRCIEWQRVASEYDGIIITPYQYRLRLADGFMWYYGWDCASGCIWNANAIRDIRLIEIDREIAKRQKEAAAA